MKNDEKKLNDNECSSVAGGNASGIHYIYQCPNCGQGAITAYDGEWNCSCGTNSRKVGDVYLDLESDEPNYGVPRETMNKYNIPDF